MDLYGQLSPGTGSSPRARTLPRHLRIDMAKLQAVVDQRWGAFQEQSKLGGVYCVFTASILGSEMTMVPWATSSIPSSSSVETSVDVRSSTTTDSGLQKAAGIAGATRHSRARTLMDSSTPQLPPGDSDDSDSSSGSSDDTSDSSDDSSDSSDDSSDSDSSSDEDEEDDQKAKKKKTKKKKRKKKQGKKKDLPKDPRCFVIPRSGAEIGGLAKNAPSGRTAANQEAKKRQFRLNDAYVSKSHLAVECHNRQFTIQDVGTLNGTYYRPRAYFCPHRTHPSYAPNVSRAPSPRGRFHKLPVSEFQPRDSGAPYVFVVKQGDVFLVGNTELSAKVLTLDPEPQLTIEFRKKWTSNTSTVSVGKEGATVGRDASCAIVVGDEGVRATHAHINFDDVRKVFTISDDPAIYEPFPLQPEEPMIGRPSSAGSVSVSVASSGLDIEESVVAPIARTWMAPLSPSSKKLRAVSEADYPRLSTRSASNASSSSGGDDDDTAAMNSHGASMVGPPSGILAGRPSAGGQPSDQRVRYFPGVLRRMSPQSVPSPKIPLSSGDVLRVGRTEFVVRVMCFPAPYAPFPAAVRPRLSGISASSAVASDAATSSSSSPSSSASTSSAAASSATGAPDAAPSGPVAKVRATGPSVVLTPTQNGMHRITNWRRPQSANSLGSGHKQSTRPSASAGSSRGSVLHTLWTTPEEESASGDEDTVSELLGTNTGSGSIPRTTRQDSSTSDVSSESIVSLRRSTSRVYQSVYQCTEDAEIACDCNFPFRSQMEDRAVIVTPFGGKPNSLFGVFDGHGDTWWVADFAASSLPWMLYDELVALGVLRTYPKHTPIHRDSANSWFITQQLQQYHAQDHKEDVEDNSSSGASKTSGDCKTMSSSDSKWQLETPDTKPHPMPLDRSQSMSIKASQPQPSASAVEADSPSITEDWKEHQVEFYDTVEGPPPSTALVPLALYRAFRSVTLQLQSTDIAKYGGSTACLALLYEDTTEKAMRLVVGNTGDAQAVLFRDREPLSLTMEHRAANALEEKRVTVSGGRVVNQRILGLEVSRALGDLSMSERGVSSSPFICDTVLGPDDAFLCIASDGLWGQVPPAKVRDFLYDDSNKDKSAESLGQLLVEEALSKGSGDNVCCVVVKLAPVTMSTD